MRWASMERPGSHGAYCAGRWSCVCCYHGSFCTSVSWKVSSLLGKLHILLLSSLTVFCWLCLLEVRECLSLCVCFSQCCCCSYCQYYWCYHYSYENLSHLGCYNFEGGRQCDPLKCQELFTQWHSVTLQKTCIFSRNTVRALNLLSWLQLLLLKWTVGSYGCCVSHSMHQVGIMSIFHYWVCCLFSCLFCNKNSFSY
jgi:hypothetical protein